MKPLLFRPLFESDSCTYTYLLADPETKEAVIIDAVLETQARDVSLIKELGLKLQYIMETHIHADHITSAQRLKEQFAGAQIVLSAKACLPCADQPVKEGDVLSFGRFTIRVLETPGHTAGCISYCADGKVFTGDALLIRSCGRCDFQGGSAKVLYHSLQKLFSLPDDTVVCPAHDYNGLIFSSIGEEKMLNKMAGGNTDEATFIKRINEMKLSLPRKFHTALSANQLCGA